MPRFSTNDFRHGIVALMMDHDMEIWRIIEPAMEATVWFVEARAWEMSFRWLAVRAMSLWKKFRQCELGVE